MRDKPFALGLLVGRFQTLHSGHELMIRRSLELCERTAVFIGSSQESGTSTNPFSYETRQAMLKAVFGDALEVYPLPDLGVGNNCTWGEYVLRQVILRTGAKPDLFVTGREERRKNWFGFEGGNDIYELTVPKTISISASLMREYLINGEREKWESYTNPALYPLYSKLRDEAVVSQSNTETRSI